jgi:hypothetical protein
MNNNKREERERKLSFAIIIVMHITIFSLLFFFFFLAFICRERVRIEFFVIRYMREKRFDMKRALSLIRRKKLSFLFMARMFELLVTPLSPPLSSFPSNSIKLVCFLLLLRIEIDDIMHGSRSLTF